MTRTVRRPRILFSFPAPSATSNPFTELLTTSVSAEVDTQYFSWARALLGRYDIFHVHWPELLIRGQGKLKRPLKRLAARLLLLRLRTSHRRLIVTAHNLEPHDPLDSVDGRLLDKLNAQVDHWIVLTPLTKTPSTASSTWIPHGHYRDWYPSEIPIGSPEGLLHFGIIRPYKGVDTLIRAYRDSDATVLRPLTIMGRLDDEEMRRALVQLAGDVRDIRLTFEHVGDSELGRAIAAAQLVVLPYRRMHNSGAVLLSLSYNTPVLVPRNGVTEELVEEFGEEAVLLYDGELSATDLENASRVFANRTDTKPHIDMSTRDWAPIGRSHAELYRKIAAVAE